MITKRCFYRRDFYLLFLLPLFILSNSYAQNGADFITEMEVNVDELNDLQREHLTRLESHANVTEMWFVNVADLKTSQSNGYLWLSLPGKDCIAQIKAMHVESSLEEGIGDYSWYGEVKLEGEEGEEMDTDETSFSCYDGMVSLMKSGDIITGQMSIDEDRYELYDLGGEVRVLLKKEFSEATGGCGMGSTANGTGDLLEDEIFDRAGLNCPIKVLALYTPNADNKVPNIDNVIRMTMAQANQALRNSDISASQVQYVLSAVEPYHFIEGGQLQTNPYDATQIGDIEYLIGDQDLQDLKDDRNADIVVLFTDGPYYINGIAGGYFPNSSNDAVCVVQIDDAMSDFRVAHEIGHIMGCRHHRCVDTNGLFGCESGGTIGHAHTLSTGFIFTRVRYTLMVGQSLGRSILHYSNPNVKYKNKKTGEATARYNAAVIRQNVCAVADYERDPNLAPLSVSIAGTRYNCPCRSATMSTNIFGAVAPYTQQWRTSPDGLTWSSVQGTGTNFSTPLPCTVGDGVYVRLDVTSTDGKTARSFRFFQAAMTWPSQQGFCMREDGEEAFLADTDIQAFPNPFNHSFTIIHPVQEGDVNLRVFDKLGKLIQSKTVAAGSSSQTVFDAAHLPAGIYVVEIETKDKTFTRKLAKL